jgi:DNA-binding transcriptional LysR family regulator
MDRMTSMSTFVKVVESGGFSAAARKLDISPSMVTTHVQALEERLGVRLLNRSTRRVSLTEAGHAYYERCLQILSEVDDADHVVQALQSTPRGTLRLNTSVAIPPFLAPVINEFVALYPEVSISMSMTDRMIDLVEEGFDLAVRNMSVPDSSLIARRIATYRFVVCGAPGYLAARGTPQRPDDLVHHNCLVYSQSGSGNEWRFAGPDGEQSVTVSGNLLANSGNSVAAGGGARPGTGFGAELLAHRRHQIGSSRSGLARVPADRACHQRHLSPPPLSVGKGPQLHRSAGQALRRGSGLGRSLPILFGRATGDGRRRSGGCAAHQRGYHRRDQVCAPAPIGPRPAARRALPRRRDFASLPDRRGRRGWARGPWRRRKSSLQV